MMHRGGVAREWRRIMRSLPATALERSGKLLARPHGFDALPQPGFVGRLYDEGGLLILGLNPAAGGHGLSPDDRAQYELLHELREASDTDVEAAFERLMSQLATIMPAWKIFANNGINAVLRAHGIAFDHVAYLNICKWRTIDANLSARLLKDAGEATESQIAQLKPARTIVLGKRAWRSWWLHQPSAGEWDVCIPRSIGDAYPNPSAAPVLQRLIQEPLSPCAAAARKP